MQDMSLLFSLLFISGSLICLFWGVYIIRLNLKSNINRVFLLLCIALSIWFFGFAMANSSSNLNAAFFWRRFASIGMTSIFSLILHFLLLLTRQNEDKKLNKILYLLYIPGLICMYVFTFSSSFAIVQYDLVKTAYGLTNIASNTIWNYFYYSYYSLYMILSLVIVWKWKDRIKEKAKIRQANIIIVTMLAAAILGTLTDIISTTFMSKPLPQMAPLFILMPVWAMYRSARYYDVFNVETSKKEEIIVSSEEQKSIFTNLSIAFYIAALLAFLSEYIPYMGEENASKHALTKGLVILSVGIIIRIIQNIKKEHVRTNLTILILVLSVPICLFQFLEYSSITVWAFPMIIIMSSVIFSKRILLFSITIVSIITQILIWSIHPEITVVVEKYDYILRIGIFLVAFFIGLYTNRMYVAKIKENNYQIEFQKMVSAISFDFVSLNQENFEEKVNSLLAEIGRFFHVDRTYLFTINHNNDTMTYSNEWCNNGINEEVGSIEEIPLDVFPWWIDQLNKKKLVYIEDVDYMPEEASAEQEQLHRQNVKSLISVPIMENGKIQAFIGIDSVISTKKWSEENIELLNIMANILSSGMTQIEADKQVEFMAYYDNLTKLPNRFLFSDRVNQAIELSKRTGKLISIIFIDLDNFKSVNDTIGHKGGDVLLQQVAKRLVGVLRKTDTVARFGGDEFMIMLNNITDYDMVTKIADKIMEIFSETFVVNNQEFLITASAGIAISPIDGEESEILVKNADIAMYKAKAKGKNQYALCSKAMKEEVQMSMELSNDLYRALDRNELVVYYQPQIDLVTKKISGAEALLRWMHPTRGMISPGIFIPIAEKNSLINSIGEWVLREACIQNKKWQDKGLPEINIAINLSAIQILNPKLSSNLANIIKETGLDPKYIELEITESIAIKETNHVIEVLNKLKKIGVSIAIDDFGTEYSSLSRLKMLPIDRIKIDMQFIQGLETNEKDKSITMVIINLAKSLGMNVLAEGVETENQLDFLNQKMCNNVQGYYYYKPMPADEMEKILVDLSRLEGEFIPK